MTVFFSSSLRLQIWLAKVLVIVPWLQRKFPGDTDLSFSSLPSLYSLVSHHVLSNLPQRCLFQLVILNATVVIQALIFSCQDLVLVLLPVVFPCFTLVLCTAISVSFLSRIHIWLGHIPNLKQIFFWLSIAFEDWV